jgi:hypothetical protein
LLLSLRRISSESSGESAEINEEYQRESVEIKSIAAKLEKVPRVLSEKSDNSAIPSEIV